MSTGDFPEWIRGGELKAGNGGLMSLGLAIYSAMDE